MNATPEDLATTFTAILRSWLTVRELSDIDATNRRRNDDTTSRTCASHDYCDPNEAMQQAMTEHDVSDDNLAENEAACELWSAAWSIAKARGFAS
tara:strand:+ start:932 stop:1216 length:285 start_codon:yes stop_codon:yes gene_type:complete